VRSNLCIRFVEICLRENASVKMLREPQKITNYKLFNETWALTILVAKLDFPFLNSL